MSDPGDDAELTDSQIMRRARVAGVVLDRLWHPATLFVWAAVATVVNLALLAERAGVVTYHPENLEGFTAQLETVVEWIMQFGSLGVFGAVFVRWLYHRGTNGSPS